MTIAESLATRFHGPFAHAVIQGLGWTLLHFLWQGALVAVVLKCVLVLTRRRSAEERYVAACIALLSMLALPALTFVRLAQAEYRLALEQANTVVYGGIFVLNVGIDATTVGWAAWLTARLDEAMPWLMAVWCGGVFLFSCRLALGIGVARGLKLAGTEAVSADLLQVFEGLRIRLGITRAVRLAHTTRMQVPAVIGWLKPVVLLPAACLAGMSPQQVEALLAHELGHVLRNDYVVSVFQSVVETVLFYHPAVWWVSRQVRRERECCCDELAVRVSGDRLAYARALSLLEERRALLPELALGANGGVLTMRIKRLLGCKEETAPANVVWVVVLTIAIAGSAGIVGRLAYAQVQARPAEASAAGEASQSIPSPAAQSAPISTAGQTPPSQEDQPVRTLSPEEARRQVEAAENEVREAEQRAQEAKQRIAQAEMAIDFAERGAGISTEDSKKLVEARKTLAEAEKNLYSDALRKQIEEIRRQFESPEFKKQMEEARQQINSPEFRRQLEELKERLNSPEFKTQMETAKAALQNQIEVMKQKNDELKKSLQQQMDTTRKQTEGYQKQAGELPRLERRYDSPEQAKVTQEDQASQTNQAELERQPGQKKQIGVENRVQELRNLAEQRAAAALREWMRATMQSRAYAGLRPGSSGDRLLAPNAQSPMGEEPKVRAELNAAGPMEVSPGVMQTQIRSRTNPVYPPEAKRAGIQGTVVLKANVGKDGSVQSMEVISGPQELRQSALDAVGQWKYKPYLLNGKRAEVQTIVQVNYTLANGAAGVSAGPQSSVAAPDGVRHVGGSVSPPEVVSKVEPQFSEEARKLKSGGVVVVGLIVDAHGLPQAARIVRGVGMGLDEQALQAVQAYRFKPAMENGKPVPVQVNVEVNFKYEDKTASPAPQGSAAAPAGVRQVGGGVTAPVLVSTIEPEFSEQARKAKFMGIVTVGFVVDAHGKPQNVRVVRGVGMGLDEQALKAVRGYRFKPAMENGKPVAAPLKTEVNFQIF